MFTKSQSDSMTTPLGRLLPRSLVRDRAVYVQIPPGRSIATCAPLQHLMRCYDYLGVHKIVCTQQQVPHGLYLTYDDASNMKVNDRIQQYYMSGSGDPLSPEVGYIYLGVDLVIIDVGASDAHVALLKKLGKNYIKMKL